MSLATRARVSTMAIVVSVVSKIVGLVPVVVPIVAVVIVSSLIVITISAVAIILSDIFIPITTVVPAAAAAAIASISLRLAISPGLLRISRCSAALFLSPSRIIVITELAPFRISLSFLLTIVVSWGCIIALTLWLLFLTALTPILCSSLQTMAMFSPLLALSRPLVLLSIISATSYARTPLGLLSSLQQSQQGTRIVLPFYFMSSRIGKSCNLYGFILIIYPDRFLIFYVLFIANTGDIFNLVIIK